MYRVRKCDLFPLSLSFVDILPVLQYFIMDELCTGYSKTLWHRFPDGLNKDKKLENVVITPTTKSDTGDVPISPEIVEQGLMSKSRKFSTGKSH